MISYMSTQKNAKTNKNNSVLVCCGVASGCSRGGGSWNPKFKDIFANDEINVHCTISIAMASIRSEYSL